MFASQIIVRSFEWIRSCATFYKLYLILVQDKPSTVLRPGLTTSSGLWVGKSSMLLNISRCP